MVQPPSPPTPPFFSPSAGLLLRDKERKGRIYADKGFAVLAGLSPSPSGPLFYAKTPGQDGEGAAWFTF